MVPSPRISEGYVTNGAAHTALKLMAWGRLTFNEKATLHRVGRGDSLVVAATRRTAIEAVNLALRARARSQGVSGDGVRSQGVCVSGDGEQRSGHRVQDAGRGRQGF